MIGEACPTHHRWIVLRYADGTIKTRDCPECPKYTRDNRRGLFDMRHDLGRAPSAQEWQNERRTI